MGCLCSKGSSSPSSSTSKKKKGKKKGKTVGDNEEGDGNSLSIVLANVENPMTAAKKKRRESTLLEMTAATTPPVTTSTSSTPSRTRGSIFGSTTKKKNEEPSAPSIVDVMMAALTEEEVANMGKCGWLYRENEHYEHDKRNEEPYLRKWLTISQRQLAYYSKQPVNGVKTTADGYLNLLDTTEVKLRHITKLIKKGNADKSGGGGAGNFCFQVKDASASITFAAATDTERDEWMNQIKAAIGGLKHTMPPHSMLVTKPDTEVSDMNNVELPKKSGLLRKHSIGGIMGIRTNHLRLFKLEAGDLRYYACSTEDERRPSKLKGAVSLFRSILMEDADPLMIQISLYGGKVLRLEAETPEIALEWRNVIRETLVVMTIRGETAGGLQTKRRLNLADVSNASEEAAEKGKGPVEKVFRVSDKSPKTLEVIRACIAQHFLLKTVKDVDSIIEGMHKAIMLPGDIIIAQGTFGDLFYILEEGLADVVSNGFTLPFKFVGGKAFGDLALLNSSARTATIRAAQRCVLWTLDRKTFRKVLSNQEKSALAEKVAFLKQVKLFEKIGDHALEKIADVMNLITFAPKQKIFNKGDAGDCFYMVVSGKVSIYIPASFTGAYKELIRLGPGKCFGELALTNDAPRAASASAVDRTQCWSIDRINFKNLLGSVKEAENESIGFACLQKVKILKSLSQKQLTSISRCLTNVQFEEGSDIIHQGDEGDSFFMIASGEVEVSVNHVVVAKLGVNAFFGEQSLMRNEKRSATVTATKPVTCLALSRADFTNLLGPLDSIMKAEAAKRAKGANEGGFFSSVFGSSSQETKSPIDGDDEGRGKGESSRKVRNVMFDLDRLDRIRVIGKGTFSKVYLVRQTQNDTYFALKVMQKETLVLLRQERAVFTERDVMTSFDFPFIAALYATFEDANCIYMVQQFMPGGDLWSLLNSCLLPKTKMGGLEVEHAAFYISNAVAAIAHMHENDVCFRDVKPENFGVDSTGFLRVFDFGNAKKLKGDASTNTMVGTPEYIAPEVVMSRDHNRAIDMWALGVMLFELLTKSTPFEHANPAMIYQNIVEAREMLKTSFPLGFSADARDLICKLLTDIPFMRLGMRRNGIADVWAHPFFRGFAQESVTKRDVPPPFVPEDQRDVRSTINDLIIGDFDADNVPKFKGTFDFSNF